MVYSCVSITFLYRVSELTVGLLRFLFFFASQTWNAESMATAPVYVKTAVLLGISFFLVIDYKFLSQGC